MYAIRSYYARALAMYPSSEAITVVAPSPTACTSPLASTVATPASFDLRITSYNVCYTKLLRTDGTADDLAVRRVRQLFNAPLLIQARMILSWVAFRPDVAGGITPPQLGLLDTLR